MKSLEEKQNNQLFTIIWRDTLAVMALISLSKTGATMIDGIIMVRAYGADSAAAMGLVMPFGTLASLVGGLLGTGCQSICAGAYARGDVKTSNRAFTTAFFAALVISLLITLGAYRYAEPVCAFLGAKGESASLLPETAAYLRGVAVGTAAMVLNLILSPVVQLYGGGTWVKRSIRLIFVSDVLFDVLAVILDLGSWGISLATALSNIVGMCLMLFSLLFGNAKMSLSPRLFDFTLVRAVLKQGTPEAFKRFFRMAGDVFANIIVLATATGAAMAGKTLGNLIISLFTTLGLGAASALYLLSGAYIAMEDEDGLLSLGRKQLLHLLITLALTALSFVFTPALVDLILKADAETKRISVSCIRCMLLQMPVYVAFEMITSYLQSIGHRKEANTMSFLGNTLLYLPLVALLGLRFRAEGVILSTPIALLFTLAVFYARRSLKLRRPAGLRDIMHVSECIHPEEIDVAARCTVQTIEDAVRCSEEIRTGLLGKGADKRTAFLLSLFVEEICSNIIEHGFRKSDAERRLFASHPYAASVFAFLHDGVITLRIYDNCILFDPREKLRSIEEREKDPERGLGLKLIFAMADEASYTSLLNMNHMLIRLPLRGSAASSEKGKKTLTCYDERFSS